MNDLKNKSTIFIIIALLIVCGGSFFGVRSLNKSQKTQEAQTSVTTTESSTTTTKAPTLVTSTSPVVSNLAVSDDVQAQAPSQESSTTSGSAADILTTFAVVGNADDTTAAETTTTEATTTTAAPTTDPNTTTTQETTNPYSLPEEVIERAAIYDKGFLSYLFDGSGNFFYTASDPWQRNLGFNQLYDVAAPFTVMYYDTLRCYFTYDNKDWLIQFWKGQYGWIFIGQEIGVYNKPTDRAINHYDCASDEDSLYMSMTGYRKGEEIFTRDYAKYWWCTGFVPGQLDNMQDRSELTMKARITLKDYEMLIAFCASLKENGLVLNQDFTTDGLDVFVTW